jgi:hypothetical protein
MAAISGGLTADICGSFTDAADAVRTSVSSFNRHFALRGHPDPVAPMTVSINGATQLPAEWSYYGSRNELIFESAPPPNAQVAVTYTPRCD